MGKPVEPTASRDNLEHRRGLGHLHHARVDAEELVEHFNRATGPLRQLHQELLQLQLQPPTRQLHKQVLLVPEQEPAIPEVGRDRRN